MSIPDVQPSKLYYGLAVLIIILGFFLFAWSLFSGISQMESSLVQFAAPGSAELDLAEPGEYTIFYENRTYFQGKSYITNELISGLQVAVVEKSTGRNLAVHSASGSFTYSLGSRSGRSIMAFDVEQPGIYQINATYARGTGPEVILAVGHGFAEGIFSGVLLSLAALFGSIILGGVVALLTYTKRKKALEQQRSEERLIRGAS